MIRGRVKGAIRAGRVIIQESAHVESDISHDKLSIEEGAYFKGTSTALLCIPATRPCERGLLIDAIDCSAAADTTKKCGGLLGIQD